MAHTKTRRLILDLDSSASPVHGRQEGANYNGHYGRVCYHPLFCFNRFGDCEGVVLREGNVSSAEGWRELFGAHRGAVRPVGTTPAVPGRRRVCPARALQIPGGA